MVITTIQVLNSIVSISEIFSSVFIGQLSSFRVYKFCNKVIEANTKAIITEVPIYKLMLKISDTIIKLFQNKADTGSPIAESISMEYAKEVLGITHKIPVVPVGSFSPCCSICEIKEVRAAITNMKANKEYEMLLIRISVGKNTPNKYSK